MIYSPTKLFLTWTKVRIAGLYLISISETILTTISWSRVGAGPRASLRSSSTINTASAPSCISTPSTINWNIRSCYQLGWPSKLPIAGLQYTEHFYQAKNLRISNGIWSKWWLSMNVFEITSKSIRFLLFEVFLLLFFWIECQLLDLWYKWNLANAPKILNCI